MVKIDRLDLNIEDGQDVDATLEVEIVFSDEEQQEGQTYEIVGGLVEVDEEVDQFEIEEVTIVDPITGEEVSSHKTISQTAVGDQDNILGVIGGTIVDADLGRDTITFTEDLGSVTAHIDDTYIINSADIREGNVDDGVVDWDSSDDDDEEYAFIQTSELRGMVWIAPEDVTETAFSSDYTEIDIYYAEG